jgi:hypothetical protein
MYEFFLVESNEKFERFDDHSINSLQPVIIGDELCE